MMKYKLNILDYNSVKRATKSYNIKYIHVDIL